MTKKEEKEILEHYNIHGEDIIFYDFIDRVIYIKDLSNESLLNHIEKLKDSEIPNVVNFNTWIWILNDVFIKRRIKKIQKIQDNIVKLYK